MTVDYGQDLSVLKNFLQQKRLHQHIVQPLQRKDDYARRYPEQIFRRRPLSSSMPFSASACDAFL